MSKYRSNPFSSAMQDPETLLRSRPIAGIFDLYCRSGIATEGSIVRKGVYFGLLMGELFDVQLGLAFWVLSYKKRVKN